MDCATYTQLNRPQTKSFNTGQNGIWLRYLWYFGKKSNKEKDELITRLAASQMKYAFFHVRSTDSNGNLKFRYEQQGHDLVDLVHKRLPGLKVIAWLYVPSNIGQSGVDLKNATTRKNIAKSASWLVDKCGFDGVQLDYEFFPDNDTSFPLLLDETRAAIGRDKFLSVATPMWYPKTLWGWSDAHFTSIAGHCDQIAIMGYDSWFYFPRAYEWLMAQQVIHVTKAVKLANPQGHCKVLIGVPVYDTDKGTPAHMTYCENILIAIRGLKVGLSSPESDLAVFEGIAPFAEYTMDEDEWRQYRKWWLGETTRYND